MMILMMIQLESDYIYVNLYWGIAHFIAGICSLFILKVVFKVGLTFRGIGQIGLALKEGWPIFVSNVAGYVSTNSYIVVLGFFTSGLMLGFYSIAEKLYLAVRYLPVILFHTVYPKVCLLAADSFFDVTVFLRRFVRMASLLLIPITIALFASADYIIYFLAGQWIAESALLLRILCVAPFIAVLNIPPCQVLLAYDFKKSYTIVSIGGALISIIFNLILVQYFYIVGTAVSVVLTEIFVSLGYYLYFRVFHQQYSIFNIFRPSFAVSLTKDEGRN